MSSAQKRIYTIEQVQGESITYNIPIAFQLSRPIDLEKLTRSLNELIKRHQVLRTYFEMIDGKFGQIVEEEYSFEIEMITESSKLLSTIMDEFVRPFSVDTLPLLRVCYCTLVTGERYLLLDAHHIIMDGGSMGIFLEELSQLYNDKLLPPVKLQYKDYSAWHRKKDKEASKQFWLEEFSDGLPEFELFYDYPRPKEREYRGDTVSACLTAEQIKLLNHLTEKTSTTNYMIFIACFMIFLSKYSGGEDVVIGTTMSGRVHPDIQNLLGMFVNTVPINDRIKSDEAFIMYLERVKHKLMKSFDHQDYPLDEIIEALNVPICENKNPIFDILFNYQSNGQLDVALGESQLTEVPRDSDVAKFDLTFNLGIAENQVELVWEYDVNLFKKSTIERMQQHFITLMGAILAEPTKTISAFSCLENEEVEKIMTQFNASNLELADDATVIKFFAEQVEKYPENSAIVGINQTLTYAELDQESTKIASLIQTKKAGSKIVAILAAREVQTIVAYLGILKAGCAYLPLDPKSPKKRNKEIVENSQAALLIDLTTDQLDDEFLVEQVTAADLLNPDLTLDYQPVSLSKQALAYVIYTSGTTGEPKGTMIEHKSIIRLVKEPNYIQLEQPNILQTGSLTFDASTFEIWGALLNGGTLYLSEIENLVDPEKLKEMIETNQIDVMWLTSSLFNQLVSLNEQTFSALNYLLIGGEKLSNYHVSKFKQANQRTHLLNGYGPTECTTFALTYEITEPFMQVIPIGKPINYTQALVFSDDALCGIGMPGELYLGGIGLARGYLGQEELTNEKFIENPFTQGEKLYKTGDLVRWDEEGQVEFLGRIDQQVKIRGFRIELKEIEAHLLGIAEIKEAAVKVVESQMSAEKQLIVYVSTTNEMSSKQIKEQLRENLPEYMIPKAIILLESLPTTKNGKLAVDQLPEQSIDLNIEAKEQPETPVQNNILTIFKEILNLDDIGINEDFYDLGGDSIKAIRIVSKLKEQGFSLTINDILHNRTIKELSKNLKQNKKIALDQREVTGEVLFTPIQKKFFEEQLVEPNHFNQSIMLEFATEQLNKAKITEALKAIMSHHDMLRAVYSGRQSIKAVDTVASFTVDHYTFKQESQTIDWFDQTTEIYQSIQKLSNTAQANLSLSNGEVFKAVIYQFEDRSFLLLIAHHLVVDTISWKIILEDLETAYKNLMTNQPIKLPLKTMSYQKWSQALTDYSKSEELAEELSFWQETATIVEQSQIQDQSSTEKNKRSMILSAQLGVEKTIELLTQKNRFNHFYVNEILITALTRAIANVTENKAVSLLMEGHGREQLTEEIEIDRTVGWFTITYPVAFSLENASLEADILEVNRSLKAIPKNGIGYGLAKTLLPEISKHEPMVTFNYSGEFNESQQAEQLFTMSPAPQGNEVSPNNQFGTPIAVNLVIVDKNLNSNIVYNNRFFSEEFIKQVSDRFLAEINQIVRFLQSEPQQALDEAYLFVPINWNEQPIKQTIQPSAMQRMFLETLEETMVYAPFELHTTDQERIVKALRKLIEEQALLRTTYGRQGAQYVLYEHQINEEVTIPFIDLRFKTEEESFSFQQEIKDKMIEGFKNGQSNALYHMLLTPKNDQTTILHLLISHSIWDKYSDEVFYDRLKEYILNPVKNSPTVLDYALPQTNIKEQTDLNALNEHLSLFKKSKESIYANQDPEQPFSIGLSTLSLGEKTKKYYAKNHWVLIMYLAQIIIRENHRINDGEILPVYVVQENRKYLPANFSQAIGPFIDLWPILLDQFNSNVQEQMNQLHQLKMETQVSLIDELSKIDSRYTSKEIYSINNQTIFELTRETLEMVKKQVETMTQVKGLEIVINKYLDQLVLIYPESISQKNQLAERLQKACDQFELELR
ncbi:amino acid adenylation domain-containing protein [Enterococcus haemoperoxidus]|nr:amino acid adenylation domain-containing protein [Enterococcus haemoperoxidus]